jgi:two-component system chemotaxis sensor kinase CheA/two-component system sensor histidine kinase and response regulator WspE
MPVVALGPLLSLNGGPRSKRPHVAHVVHGSEGAAVVVDGLFGEREVAVKASGAFLKGMRFVTGAAALEDGRVALLLSTSDLVGAARRLASPAASRGRDRRRLRILLVDDSAIAREAEAALLRSLGHEVDEAVDGEDGWAKLQGGAYHLLVTDVQMPVLDGIDLTRRVKATPRFVKLPIVILSSLSAPEERRRGVDAGADAYLVKGELEAESFAGTLERLTGVGA